MYTNMGTYDRLFRGLAGILIAFFYFMGFIPGLLAIVLGLISLVFIATSAIGFCPIYFPFHLTTKVKG